MQNGSYRPGLKRMAVSAANTADCGRPCLHSRSCGHCRARSVACMLAAAAAVVVVWEAEEVGAAMSGAALEAVVRPQVAAVPLQVEAACTHRRAAKKATQAACL